MARLIPENKAGRLVLPLYLDMVEELGKVPRRIILDHGYDVMGVYSDTPWVNCDVPVVFQGGG